MRRYPRVCGMTATAVAVGEELREFYGLEVAVVPPNRPCVREDRPSRLYATVAEKGEGRSAGEVAAAHATGRPVLIGTLDIAESERIAHRLSLAGLGCAVLNAKNDAEEAAIVAGGRRVRGHHRVDADGRARHRAIRLGGREGDHGQVAALGGLRVIGTGRYWSSKARQPAARAVRPPGRPPVAPVFFASMEDQLVEHYAPDADPPRGAAADGSVADAGRTGRSITRSEVAEDANLEIHRNTWRCSKLVEDQRRLVLEQRQPGADHRRGPAGARPPLPPAVRGAQRHGKPGGARRRRPAELVLYHLDRGWADHLAALADIRQGIHLRALGRGLSPLNEFHREAVTLFSRLLRDVEERSAETFRPSPSRILEPISWRLG